jgi:hypothetical protein
MSEALHSGLRLLGKWDITQSSPSPKRLHAACPDGMDMESGAGAKKFVAGANSGSNCILRVFVPSWQKSLRGKTLFVAKKKGFFRSP